MKLPQWALTALREALAGVTRPPDFVVGAGSPGGAYLERWWIIPRNPVFNIYLHHFLRDDDDRALHDHPWASLSLMLVGVLFEQTDDGPTRRRITAGDIVFRRARFRHRLELGSGRATTLFITGPRVRAWGFWCPQGFVPWRRFTAADRPGDIGPGCGE